MRLALVAALQLGALGLGCPAEAQTSDPSAADLASARELYREGKELRTKGDLRGALERFKAAHSYGQTPVTGLELGKTHMQLGELVEARETFLSIGRLKVASDETEKSADARKEAEELAESLRPRIPTLVVKVSGLPPGSDPKITVDGAATPMVESSSMRKVNPGEHAIVIHAGTREEKRSVALAEGETKDVDVTFPAVAEQPKAPAAAGEKRPIHVLTWIGAGVGVAGLAVGTVTGLIALNKAGAVTDACRGLVCPPSAKSDVDAGRTAGNISTIGFALAGVGVAAAAVGFFVLSPRSSTAPTGAQVTLGPTGAGIHGTF